MQTRNGEGDLNPQEIAEDAKTSVQNDVANLGKDLPSPAIEGVVQAGFIGQQIVQHAGAALVHEQECITRNRPGKHLVNTGHLALNFSAEHSSDFLDRVNGNFRNLKDDAVTGQ